MPGIDSLIRALSNVGVIAFLLLVAKYIVAEAHDHGITLVCNSSKITAKLSAYSGF